MKKLFFSLIILAISHPIYAALILGGSLNYTFNAQSGGLYKYDIQLSLYKNCAAGSNNFDFEVKVGCFKGDTLVGVQTCNFTGKQDMNMPDGICTQVGNYTGLIILPPHSTGYTLVYQRCCRDNVTENLGNGNDNGMSITAKIPPAINSCPNFSSFFPSYAVVNQPFSRFYNSIDADGDLIVYELDELYNGGSPLNPFPNPPSAPPYTPTGYLAPYSVSNMTGATVPLAWNSTTGLLTATPANVGRYSIGIKITEIRNGSILATHHQEHTLYVTNGYPTSISPQQSEEISLYPNPTNSLIKVASPRKILSLEVKDLCGKLICYESNKEEVNVQHLPSGMYLLVVHTHAGTSIEKFLKVE